MSEQYKFKQFEFILKDRIDIYVFDYSKIGL